MQNDKINIKKSTKTTTLFKNNHFAIGGVMSLGIRISAIDSKKYGAIEIKNGMKKNTFVSFGNVMLILSIAISLTIAFSAKKVIEKIIDIPSPLVFIPDGKIDEVHKTEKLNNNKINNEFAKIENLATKEVAGTIVAIDDPEITKNLKNFSTFDNLENSLSKQDGIITEDIKTILGEIEKPNVKTKIEIPITDEPVEVTEVEIEPNVDLENLMKSIVYPEMARQIGLEGTVILRVLIDKNGKVTKTEILRADSKILENSAIEAVKKSVFTPAIQNGLSVSCWVAIPIQFRLK